MCRVADCVNVCVYASVCVSSSTAQRSAECEGLPPTGGRVMERETRPLALVVLVGPPRGCGGAGSVVVECVVDCDLVFGVTFPTTAPGSRSSNGEEFSRVTRNRAVRVHFATRSCTLGTRFTGAVRQVDHRTPEVRGATTLASRHTQRARDASWAVVRPCVECVDAWCGRNGGRASSSGRRVSVCECVCGSRTV